MAKEPGKRIPRRSLEDTRLLVLSAIDKGMEPEEAADIFECGRSTVYGWLKARREQGPEALKVKKAPGPAGLDLDHSRGVAASPPGSTSVISTSVSDLVGGCGSAPVARLSRRVGAGSTGRPGSSGSQGSGFAVVGIRVGRA